MSRNGVGGETSTTPIIRTTTIYSRSGSEDSHEIINSLLQSSNTNKGTVSGSEESKYSKKPSLSGGSSSKSSSTKSHKSRISVISNGSTGGAGGGPALLNYPTSSHQDTTSWLEQIQFKAQYHHFRTNNYASVVNSGNSLDKFGAGRKAQPISIEKVRMKILEKIRIDSWRFKSQTNYSLNAINYQV